MPNGYGMLEGAIVLVYLVVALVLRSKKPWIPVWSIMAFASFMTILFGLLDFDHITQVVDLDVVLFLVGMFSLVGLANASGLLEYISIRFTSLFHRRVTLIYGSALLFGVLAAFAVNDTVALMGPPIAYTIATASGIDPRFMFLLLAFSLTIGSVMTPIGNPQNLLIAIQSGVKAPFIIFLVKLTVPTILNILLTALVLQGIFRIRDQRLDRSSLPRAVLRNRRDALLAGVGLVLAVVLLVVNDLLELYDLPHAEHRGIIPFILAAGTYLFTTSPRRVLSEVDWGTIVFFITMFITMDGVWRSGVLQPLLSKLLPSRELGLLGVVRITVTSILMSQLLSNVPFVKLFIEYMRNIGYSDGDVDSWLTLAISSTIAGNLTLLGAASNIIILEVLESRINSTITFTEFLKIGSIVTLLNTLIYLIFLLH